MRSLSVIALLIVLATASGCATPNMSKHEKFLEVAPRSILIVPVVNKSVDVTAADYMLSTITIPLAERGYYVFPINAVKRVLEDDGLSDSSMVHSASTIKLANLFGADAVLYVIVNQWDAKYMVTTTQVTVGINYQIRSGKTNEVLWENSEKMVYAPSNGGGGIAGLIVSAIQAAITKAAPNYMPLAHQVNNKALNVYPGGGIPFGPYAQDQVR
jgi:hypothetical protein